MASALLMNNLLFLPLFFASFGSAGVHFSSLARTLFVTASPKPGTVLRAGEDTIQVTWGLNLTAATGLEGYKDRYRAVEVKLCYAPISQKDRRWRRTEDDLSRDKTCQFQIVARPFDSKGEASYEYRVGRDVPTATYFIRVYAIDSNGNEVGYGQTTDAHKTTNLFEVAGVSGRHASLDIAAACFSAFSVFSLLGFLYLEKRRGRVSRR